MIFRLSVDDYRRYIYIPAGSEGERVGIPGMFHTVNPRAAKKLRICKENTREYSCLRLKCPRNVLNGGRRDAGGEIINFCDSPWFKRGDGKDFLNLADIQLFFALIKGKLFPTAIL